MMTKLILLLTPAGSIATAAYLLQQAKISLSAELAVTVLINVALVALAFGGIQATLRHLRADVNRLERLVLKKAKFSDDDEEL